MSNHGSGSSTKPWRPPRGNMATYPSVGRFENKPQPTLYVKGSSPKLEGNSAKISMAPHSNHGQLTQHPSSGIVDLRTAPATAVYETVGIQSCERCVIFNDILGCSGGS